MNKISKLTLLLFILCCNTLTIHAQVCTWAKSIVGTGSPGGGLSDPFAIVVDASGNVYVTGQCQGDTLSFGTTSIANPDSENNNIYVAKCDSSGNVIWLKAFGQTQYQACYVNSMAIDHLGNIYITGTFGDSLTFGTTTLANPGIFIAKLDSAGSPLWAKDAVGGYQGTDFTTAVATDASGDVYITGSFYDTVTFGSTMLIDPFTGAVSTLQTGANMFVAKYDSLGNLQWAKCATGSGEGIKPNSIAADAAGNIYITGYYEAGSVVFGGITLTNPIATDMFLVKYNASGTVVWANSAGANDFVDAVSVATDLSGNVYVAGEFDSVSVTFGTTTLTNANIGTNDIFLVKYNAAGGVTWAVRAGGGGSDEPYAITTDAAGDIYMSGEFQELSLTFGASTLTNMGMFVAKYNSSGAAIWGKDASSGTAIATALVTDKFDHLFVTGIWNYPSLTLDAITLPDPTFTQNTFVARYDNITASIPTVNATVYDLAVFPNPAATSLTITSTENITNISITNLIGQAVPITIGTHGYNSPQVNIDVAGLPPGIYFVKVQFGCTHCDSPSVTKKFVKE